MKNLCGEGAEKMGEENWRAVLAAGR